MKYYSGIGSRITPVHVLTKMTGYATRLEKLGYILRSGGAVGADTAFEQGVMDSAHKEIFKIPDATPEAEKEAERIHPAWHVCSYHAKKLHARNVQIILGRNLDSPSEFVICYSANPEYGGTRTGIVLAQEKNRRVYNLYSESCVEEFEFFLAELEATWIPGNGS